MAQQLPDEIQTMLNCVASLPPGMQNLLTPTLLAMQVTGTGIGVQRTFRQLTITAGIAATPFVASGNEQAVFAILYNAGSAAISWGASTACDFNDLGSTDSYALQAGGLVFDLSVFFCKSAGGTETLKILFC